MTIANIISFIVSKFRRHERDTQIKTKSKFIQRLNVSGQTTRKPILLEEDNNFDEIASKVSYINKELLNLKIDIENEIELYAMNKYNNELRSKNLLN